MKNVLKTCYLTALIAFLMLGCSKDPVIPVDPPPPTTSDTIKIVVSASYQAGMNISDNKLKLAVGGQPDLSFAVPLGQDYIIILTGDQAKTRKGKSATLTMSCSATNGQGTIIPVCYNFTDGKTTINSLLSNNSKIEWIGQTCGTGGDQIILRVKCTFECDSSRYILSNYFFSLLSSGAGDLYFGLSHKNVDTTYIISGADATSRINQNFVLKFEFIAHDILWNTYFFNTQYSDNRYEGGTLMADNPKVEAIVYNCGK